MSSLSPNLKINSSHGLGNPQPNDSTKVLQYKYLSEFKFMNKKPSPQ